MDFSSMVSDNNKPPDIQNLKHKPCEQTMARFDTKTAEDSRYSYTVC